MCVEDVQLFLLDLTGWQCGATSLVSAQLALRFHDMMKLFLLHQLGFSINLISHE